MDFYSDQCFHMFHKIFIIFYFIIIIIITIIIIIIIIVIIIIIIKIIIIIIIIIIITRLSNALVFPDSELLNIVYEWSGICSYFELCSFLAFCNIIIVSRFGFLFWFIMLIHSISFFTY